MDYGTPENIKNRYAAMSDKQLREFAVNRDELTDLGQDLLRQEFENRGIASSDAEDTAVISEVRGDEQRLITVRSYRDLSEAIVARAVLEEEGIFCFLRDENTVRMDWMWSNLLGGIRLQVAEEDASKADEILSQPIPESFVMEDGEVFEQPVCPKCDSVDVSANNTKQKIGLASTFATPLSMPVLLPAMALQQDDVWKCNVCGTLWCDDGVDVASAP